MARSDLIPMNRRTKEEQKKIATMGGFASGFARRERRPWKERLEFLCSRPVSKETRKKLQKLYRLKNPKSWVIDDEILSALIEDALSGDIQAIKLIGEIRGEITRRTDVTSGGEKLREPLSIEIIDSRSQVDDTEKPIAQ